MGEIASPCTAEKQAKSSRPTELLLALKVADGSMTLAMI
jgi:hypothetical protein